FRSGQFIKTCGRRYDVRSPCCKKSYRTFPKHFGGKRRRSWLRSKEFSARSAAFWTNACQPQKSEFTATIIWARSFIPERILSSLILKGNLRGLLASGN